MDNPHVRTEARNHTTSRFRLHRRIPLEMCVQYYYLPVEKLYEIAGVPVTADNPIDRMLDEMFEEMGLAGISQRQLAKKMGSADKVVSFVFTGRGNPSLKYLRRMWTSIQELKGER